MRSKLDDATSQEMVNAMQSSPPDDLVANATRVLQAHGLWDDTCRAVYAANAKPLASTH